MRKLLVFMFVFLIGISFVSSQECSLNWASWKDYNSPILRDITKIMEGDEVQLYVSGLKGCEGKIISFEVFEDDFGFDDSININPLNVEFRNGMAIGTWKAEYQQDVMGRPEYFFKAIVVNNPSENVVSINGMNAIFDRGEELVVTRCGSECQALGGICTGIPNSFYCSQDPNINQEECNDPNHIKEQECFWIDGEFKQEELDLCKSYYCLKLNEDYLKEGPFCTAEPCEEFSHDETECWKQKGCQWTRESLGCTLVSASWNTSIVEEGEIVELNIKGTFCNGEEVMFEVFEANDPSAGGEEKVLNNPQNVVFEGDIATGIWVAEWQDDYLEYEGKARFPDGEIKSIQEYELNPPEYFFIATLVNNEYETIRGGMTASRRKFIDVENKYEVFICNNIFECELVVVKGGLCEGELPLADCSNQPGESYCENVIGCSWDGREGRCYAIACSDFNNNHEGCLNQDNCLWKGN